MPATLVWEDDFNRVDPSGAGPNYTYDWGDDGEAITDGSVLTVPAPHTSVGIIGFPSPRYPVIQFDFLVTSSTGAAPLWTAYYEVQTDWRYNGIYVYDNEGGEWIFGSGAYSGADPLFYPTPGDWWTVKAEISDDGLTFRSKVWLRTDAEPAWMWEATARIPTELGWGPYLEIDSGDGGAASAMDNFYIWEYPYTPPPPPPITLTDSRWVAEDCVPFLPIDGTVANITITNVDGFLADVNDPIISSNLPHMLEYQEGWGIGLVSAQRGFMTSWVKAVLPSRGVLHVDADGTNFSNALALWQDDGAGNLTWITGHMPFMEAISHNSTGNRPEVVPVIIAGSGATATGIPGVTHNDLLYRQYEIAAIDLPGPSLSWSEPYDVGHWIPNRSNTRFLYPVLTINVTASLWNTGYSKSIRLAVQAKNPNNGIWYSLGSPWDVYIGSGTDSRTGNAFTYSHSAIVSDPSALHTGCLRLIVSEEGYGGEIWTSVRTLKLLSYRDVADAFTSRLKGAEINATLEAGTYLIELVEVLGDINYHSAVLNVGLSHPERS